MTLADFGTLATGGWFEVQAVMVVIVSLIAMRVALNWVGRGMRRASVDLGTQILVK
ncbi:MAG: hypothetical protein JO057_03560, partial [Chloroflexi bacterium]|nr:hypothetical protein [Chloroflexota bacterium]